jgi:hypothetical protein
VQPCYVGIVFSELLAVQDLNHSLFDEDGEQMRLAWVLDGPQRKYGVNAVTVGLHGERQVPLRDSIWGAGQPRRRLEKAAPDASVAPRQEPLILTPGAPSGSPPP